MAQGAKVKRIALIGNSPPRLCGIATFTADVRTALITEFPDVAVDLYAMEDRHGQEYPAEVVCSISEDDLASYHAAALQINRSSADIVCVQHEYGIFGGAAGAHLLKLLDRVDAPVVVTLHTVLEDPTADQRAVIEALMRRAAKLIVMAEKGREILERVHHVAADRIAVVPHGVPDTPPGDAVALKRRFGFSGRQVVLTFGLLSPNKGIETMIRALPAIAAAHPDLLYVVLGATHPHLVAREGEGYRESLQALAADLGVGAHVRFIDGFLEQPLLLEYLTAADIYVTPYLNEAQITSGTLSYAVALGKPVVSTPYWHAAELLANGTGVLVPFGDVARFSSEISALLGDRPRREAMGAHAWQVGRTMTWSKLARAYMALFADAARLRPTRLTRPAAPVATPVAPRLDAIARMTDGCGMIQHAIFHVPDRDHGYCVDDNCRALILMHRIAGAQAEQADRLAVTYASFVQHAWNGEIGRFRNFMAFDRSWLEREGSEDSFGRSLWSIGVTAGEARRQEMRRWALHLFDQVAPHVGFLNSMRSWAFVILGAEALLQAHPGHKLARSLVADFAARLQREFEAASRPDWPWFESVLGYDNARLPEALLRAGRVLGDESMIAVGLATLDWLDGIQTNEKGEFRAVGSDSFGRPFSPPSPFDQQPLEAWATIDAALVARAITGDARWQQVATSAYEWYLGRNDLAVPIATPTDGGCFDGLMSDRANLNQGAESILSFQFACCAMAQNSGRAVTAGDLALAEAATSRP